MYGNPTYEIDQKIKTLADSISYENQIKNDLLNLRKSTQGAPGYDYGPEIIEQDKRIRYLENQIQQLRNQKNGYGNYPPQGQPVNNAGYYNQVNHVTNDMNNMRVSQYSPNTQPQQYNYNQPPQQQSRLQPQMGAPPRSKSRCTAAPPPPRSMAPPTSYGMSQHPPARPVMNSYPVQNVPPRNPQFKQNIVQPQHYQPVRPPPSPSGYIQPQPGYGNQQPKPQGYSRPPPPPLQQNSYQQNNYQQNYQQNNYQQQPQQPQQQYYQQQSPVNNYSQPQSNYQKPAYVQPPTSGAYQGNNTYAQPQPQPQQQKQPPMIPTRTNLHIPSRTVASQSPNASPMKSPQTPPYNSQKPHPSRLPSGDANSDPYYQNQSPRVTGNDGYNDSYNSQKQPVPVKNDDNYNNYNDYQNGNDYDNYDNSQNQQQQSMEGDKYNYDYDYENDPKKSQNNNSNINSQNDDILNKNSNANDDTYNSNQKEKRKSIYSEKSVESDDNLDLYLDIYGNDKKEGSKENKVENPSPMKNSSPAPMKNSSPSPINKSQMSPQLRLNTSQQINSPNLVNSPRITSEKNSPRPTNQNLNSPKPSLVIPPRTRMNPNDGNAPSSRTTTPTSAVHKPVTPQESDPVIPPRQVQSVNQMAAPPSIPARTESNVNLDAYDFITAPDQLENPAIAHRIKKIQTKLEIENKYKLGSEKAIDVMTMSGTSKSSPQFNEAQMRLRESNEKIRCLTEAKKNYENKYTGNPIEKDLTEYPVNDIDNQPKRNTLIKTLGRIRNAQNEGKLQMKFICLQKLNFEVAAVVYVNGRYQNETRLSKGNQWNFEMDILATKDAEVEIIFENDKKSIVGLIWFKASDLEEAAKLKYAESHDINDNTYALQVEPVGELIIQLAYLRDNANFPTGTLHPGIHRRKAANKMLIYQQGHKLAKLQNYNVLKCAMCGEFILSGSGLQCAECNYACHQNCVPMITSKCISQSKSEQEENKNEPLNLFISKFNIPHRFKISTNAGTGWCSHCGQMLPIGKNSILKCSECHQVCHHGCKIYIQNLCGLSMDMVKGFTSAIEKTEREKKRNQVAELQRHHKTLIRKPPPTLKKREVTINDFHFMVVLGRGNFGKVMLAEEKSTKKLYAIKILKKQAIIDDDEVQSMMNEKSAFLAASQINHPFLVNLHSCFSSSSRIYFVMEYAQCGDLISHIGKKSFTKARAKYYLSEVLLALEFLHSKDIIYRDLKLDNILLTVEGHIKLTDFGLCKGNMTWNATTKTFCGTPEFIAPEILIGAPYTRAVDWWTFGVLIYEMIVKEAPFSGDDDEEIFDNIINKHPNYPSSMGKSTMTVCRGLLKKNPNQRLGYSAADAKEIKSQAFFSDVDWQAMLEKRIPPPYVPTLKSSNDTSLFDEEFTKEPPVLTPVQCFLDQFEQELFDGFAYVNPYLVTQ